MKQPEPRPTLTADAARELAKSAAALGIEFSELSYFRSALTLRSWLNEHPDSGWTDNQRLEFLGDAVLDLVIGEILYRRYPEHDEGVLTPMRASLVSKKALSKVATRWGLGEHLFVGSGDEKAGARTRSATLSDALEAVVAALYLDAQEAGVDAIQKVSELVARLWAPNFRALDPNVVDADPRSELQRTVQAERKLTPRYYYEPAGAQGIRCMIRIESGDEALDLGSGRGRHRKSAGDRAAKDALAKAAWRNPQEA